ncbi:phage holin family protein [Oceanospirillum sp. HFRX-1_2]
MKEHLANTWVAAFVVALWAGGVSVLQRMSRKKQPVSFLWVFGELAASSLAGMVAYWIYMSNPVDWMPVYVPVAVAGHMGGRFLQRLEEIAERKFGVGA